MGRKGNRNFDKEYTKEQKYRKELEKLKRENARLKKLIARINLEESANLKDEILRQERDNQIEITLKKQKQAEEAWRCWDCNEGILRLKIFEIHNGARYYRKCDHCSKRTSGKKYTKDVKGVE